MPVVFGTRTGSTPDGSFDQNQSSKSSKNSTVRTSGTRTTRTKGTSIVDRFDPNSRAAYNALLNQAKSGGSQNFRNRQSSINNLIADLESQRGQYSQSSARAAAQGDVAGLTRTLLEQINPQITGAVEASGASGGAVQALLQQDAATRTGEAQSRVVLQAINDFAANQRGVDQSLLQAASGPDELSELILGILNTGKGAYEKTNTDSTATEILDQIVRTNESSSSSSSASRTTGNSNASSGNPNTPTFAENSAMVAQLESLIGGSLYNQIYTRAGGGGNNFVTNRRAEVEARRELRNMLTKGLI